MIPSTGFPEPSPTIRIMGTRPLVIEILPSPVASSPLKKEVDNSRADFNFSDEPAPPHTSKFSHLTIGEMGVTSLMEMVPPPRRLLLRKVTFVFVVLFSHIL